MSRTEKPSKNSNAANHNMVLFASRKLGICGLLYDTMMMVVREPRARRRCVPLIASLHVVAKQSCENEVRPRSYSKKLPHCGSIACLHKA